MKWRKSLECHVAAGLRMSVIPPSTPPCHPRCPLEDGDKKFRKEWGGLYLSGAAWGLTVLPEVGNNISCAGGSVFLRRAKLRDGDFLNLSWKCPPRSARGQRLGPGRFSALPALFPHSWCLLLMVERKRGGGGFSAALWGWEGWAAGWGLVKEMWDSALGWFPC